MANKNGLEFLRDPRNTADDIAVVLGKGHPPFPAGESVACDYVSCRQCWLAWLTTGHAPIPKRGPRTDTVGPRDPNRKHNSKRR